ncbi:MAG: response regulator [bacterium]|nr:response regulator [bacterium]
MADGEITQSEEGAREILVADSNLARAERLAEACDELGMRATCVANGAVALERALASAPDLVVSEIDLPLVTGSKLAEILRANPRTHSVRFLFLGPETGTTQRVEVGDVVVPVTAPRDEVLSVISQQLTKCDRIEALESASQSGDTVSGDLAKLPLADLLQVAHLARKSGRVSVEREGDGEHIALVGEATSDRRERGLVVLRDGDVLRAEIGKVVGEKALFRMLAWREGSFVFESGREPDASVEITAPVRALLAEGIRQIAEWDRLALQLPPLSATVKLSVQMRELPNIVHPLTQEVLLLLEHYDRVRDIVDRCSFPDYQVLRTLQTLSQRNMVAVGQIPVRGLGPQEAGEGLFSDSQLRRLRDHLQGATPRGERVVSGKILVVACAQGMLPDWFNMLRRLANFEPAPGLGEGNEPKIELGPLGILRFDSDLELDLLQVPAADIYRPLRPLAGHGALGTFFLHGAAVSQAEAALSETIKHETATAGQHLVLLTRKEKLDPLELRENLEVLDDAEVFLIPLSGDKDPTALLRNLFARVVP